MKKRITVFIAFLVMAVFNISQYPIYAASTASATFTEKPSDMGKTGLRIERERIPNAGQKTNDINSSTGFMESADFYSGPYEYGVTIIEPLSGQNRSKVYGINSSGQVVGKSYNYTAEADDFIIDHRCTDISQIPEEWINNAKDDLHIAYGHTSHGSQLITGMNGLDAFMGGTGLYSWNDGPLAGALDIDDYFVAGDLGDPDRTTWEQSTRTYLNDSANSDVNVIIWSWCGQADTTVENIELYLSLMAGLETDYPNVKFVYMTGHLNGGGLTGNLHLRNEQIRTYCRDNNKILYDFADIETYDPDGTYFGDKIPNDNCDYDTDNNGSRDGNWAIEWQDLHVEGTDWYDCSPAHTQPLNGNLKAYAAWWLWARIAGWLSEEQVSDSRAFIWDSTNGYKVLPPLVINAESGVWGINDNGQVSGHSYNAEEHKHAVRWDNTVGLVEDIIVVDIGTLANATTGVTGETSTSYGINNLGKVVGYSDIPNDDQSYIAFHAFKYDDATGIQDLGTLTTHAPYYQNGYSISYCINSGEEAVGLAHDSLWEVLPFIHDETSGMQALNIDPDYSGSGFEWHAAVINDSGFIGGRVLVVTTNQCSPYYWENSSANPVRITMPAAFPYGEIYGINESGQMVGMMWDTDQEDAVEHAFIFDIENGVRDLNDLIDPGSQFVLQVARDINNSGQISGTCIYNDEKHGFLLNPANSVGDELAVDFGGNGLWHHSGTTWTHLAAWDPDGMAEWNGGLAVAFSPNGLWSYNGSSWTHLAAWNPDGIAEWAGDLAVDFGDNGLWSYNGSSWTHLAAWNPDCMAEWNGDLAVDFGGNGLWSYNGSSWTHLATWDPDGMTEWADGLAVDFGATYGLWNYDGSSWTHLATWDPDGMTKWADGLAVDFGATYGLWNYDGSSWTHLATWDPDGMTEWADGLAVDFGATYGLWNYDGSSWTHLATWDPEEIIDIDLY